VPTKAYWLAHLSQRDLARDDLEPVLEPGERNDFDIFGTANFNTFVPWTVSVEHVLELGVDRIRAYDNGLVERLVAGLAAAGLKVLGTGSTLVYFTHEDAARNKDLHTKLADAGIDIAFRAGKLRASPHLYNDHADIDRFLNAVVG
jgi:selenocysteine lyase/cysteine desulfurase